VQNEVRRYLLGQLEEADQERIELRLLTDPSFGEEFDTIVDEVTDQYVNNELTDEERERVEKHFLNTPERQRKLEFAAELLSHADAERGGRAERATVLERKPGLLELFLGFWRQRSFAHVALTAAAVIIVAGLIFYLMSFGDSSKEYMAVNLALSNSNRAESTAPVRVQVGSNLKVQLAVPDQAKDAQAYRVKLIDENQVGRDLTVDQRNDQTITVTIPAAWLPRGSYVIKLFQVKADGTEEPVRGSYFFNVE
jgi:uncharacterized protein (DUF2132 family)